MTVERLAERGGYTLEEVQRLLERVRFGATPVTKQFAVKSKDHRGDQYMVVTRLGVGPVETSHGLFWGYDFHVMDEWQRYTVLVKSGSRELDADLQLEFAHTEPLVVRVASGCELGMVFGDYACKCAENLDCDMAEIADATEGILISIPRQESRGLTMAGKLSRHWLRSELGEELARHAEDLVRPNEARDQRNYEGAVAIVKFLGIERVAIDLNTFNHIKAAAFHKNGYKVDRKSYDAAQW